MRYDWSMYQTFNICDIFLEESSTGDAECRRKAESWRKVTGAIRSLVNARSLKSECAKILHEVLLLPVHMYGSKTKKEERSRIRAVQMDNLRGLLSIKRMDKVPNSLIRKLFGKTKGLMKMFSDGSPMWREWRMMGLLSGCIWGSVQVVTK